MDEEKSPVIGSDYGSNQMDIAGRVHRPYVSVARADLTVDFYKLPDRPNKKEALSAAKVAEEEIAALHNLGPS